MGSGSTSANISYFSSINPSEGALAHLDISVKIFSFKGAKSYIFKGSQNGVKNYFLDFLLNKGVLGTHERGCAEVAPFWMKNNNIGTPWKKCETSKKSHF